MTCERCWRMAGGDPDRYHELLKENTCTAEQQAGGEDAGFCEICNRQTVHVIGERCVLCNSSPRPTTAKPVAAGISLDNRGEE